jgi:hypothetical protein
MSHDYKQDILQVLEKTSVSQLVPEERTLRIKSDISSTRGGSHKTVSSTYCPCGRACGLVSILFLAFCLEKTLT